jgi:parvulin-like peptidyl-prolyl isomerase
LPTEKAKVNVKRSVGVKLRHILLREKYEAEDVVRLLQQGRDFQALAKQWSTCGSAPSGGDLGEVSGRKLNADFLEAAHDLKPGEISDIVRTSFGYHIILRET